MLKLIFVAVTAHVSLMIAAHVPEKKCLRQNQVYDSCVHSCPTNTCESLNRTYHCPNEGANKNYTGGCVCEPGFYKNKIGECVTEEECNQDAAPKCGPLEVPNSCVNGGCYKERNCTHIIRPAICVDPIECKAGCLCKDGYLRDANGKCVLKNECPQKKKCPRQNQVYDSCVKSCPPNTCESLNKTYHCPNESANKKCTGGCVCEPGFFKNKIGECVTEEQCKRCSGPNEYYSCGGACDNVCETLSRQNQTICPIVNIKCNDMCYCVEGYARNGEGICVPFNECPRKDEDATPKCGPLEVLNYCVNGGCYKERNCTDIIRPIRCVDPIECKAGCLCKDGYLRAANGKCVLRNECPQKKKCPGQNQVYDSCVQSCPPNTCESLNKTYHCPNESANKKCSGGCVCEPGFFKNKIGECVTKEQCNKDAAPKCGPLEVPNSCVNGGCYKERNCTDIIRSTICVDPIECKAGCLCKDGYLRDANGKCVLRNECPQKKKCPRQYQVYDSCVQSCPPNTCESLNKTYHCPNESANKTCTGGCVCEPGFYKNNIGECITEEQCKRCSGPNEYYSCGGACDNVCETLSRQNQTSCPMVNIKCNEMCYCVEGYARNGEGICVPFNECRRKEPKCGRNEVYSSCINGGCFGAQNCSEVGAPVKCVKIDPKYCIKGCKCKDGYVKNDAGKCIREDQCPKKKKCTGRNEYHDPCPQICPPRVCGVDPRLVLCAPQESCPPPDCICKKGFYRNDNGDCITWNQCKKCTGPNEYFACGGACDNVCATLSQQNQTHCPIINKKCNEMCYCKKGYARNDKQICVPFNQCPKKDKCTGPNEHFACGGACDNVCATLSQQNQTNCLIRNIKCNEMCYCNKGYARNDKQICVPFEQCPEKVKCGKNEVLNQCPALYCKPRTCDQKGTKPFCPRISPGLPCPGDPGCLCASGYLRDTSTGFCVPENKCLKCGKNEVLNQCPALYCKPKTCDQKGTKPPCPRLSPGLPCPGDPGCLCASGYLRDTSTGFCVPENECPPQCGKNEVLDDCYNGGCYSERNCTDIGSGYKCVRPIRCLQGCLCKENYLRDKYGRCIRREQCPNYVQNDDNRDCGEDCGDNESNESGEEDDDNNTGAISDGNSADTDKQFSDGIAKFSVQFTKQTSISQKGANTVMSPFSILFILGELASYTGKGNSYNQLTTAIGLQKKDDIRSEFRSFTNGIGNLQNITFSLAARTYCNKDYPMTSAFIEDTSKNFGAGADTIDVSKPQEAADKINAWVESQTNNRIQDLVSPDSITGDTRLVLADAIYFLGKWKIPFNPKETVKRDFYVTPDNVQKVDTMYLETRVEYTQNADLNAKIIRLLYKNEKFSAIFILPNETGGSVDELFDKIQDVNNLNNALNSMTEKKVKIWLPKFKITTTIDLAEILPKVGVSDIFTSRSDLTGILESGEALAVTAAIHKAFIEITEEGTEAAAANAFGVSVTSVQLDQPVFNANHPFAFALNYDGKIMFTGVFRNPSATE